jgi:predicted nucleic acid-binding Zn ribbon protein
MSAPHRRKAQSATPDADAANLKLLGERLEVVSLHTLLTNKKRPETRDAAKLGDVLLPWYEKTVARPAAKLEGVAELWQQLVPAKIVKRSRLTGFQKGTLTVSLDSSAALAELELQLRSGLLRALQTASKGAVFRVKTCVNGAA